MALVYYAFFLWGQCSSHVQKEINTSGEHTITAVIMCLCSQGTHSSSVHVMAEVNVGGRGKGGREWGRVTASG